VSDFKAYKTFTDCPRCYLLKKDCSSTPCIEFKIMGDERSNEVFYTFWRCIV